MVYKYAFCNQNQFHPEDMTLFNHFFAQEILKEVYGNSRKDMENRWKCFIARIIHFFGIFHKTAIDAVSFFLLKQESYPDEKVFLRNFRLNFQPLVGSYGQQVFFLFLSCNSFCNTDVVVDTGTVEYLLLGIH